MVETSNQTDPLTLDEGVVEFKAKRLCDIRRYEKKTLTCPSGCEAELALNEIPEHDCVQYLKSRLQIMETKLRTEEDKVNNASRLGTHYKEHFLAQESKIDQMSGDLKELLNERSRRDEMFNSKEVFYKEQITALREQVVKLERRLQVRRPSGSSANQDDYMTEGSVRDFKYDQLMADKIGLETLFQRRERDYQREITALRGENALLRQSLHLERKILSLEHDQVAFQKLESLTDQLEEIIKQKKQKRDGAKNGRVRHRIPNSLGSWNSDITEIDEDAMEDSS